MGTWMASRSNLRAEEVGPPQVHPAYFLGFRVLFLFAWLQALCFYVAASQRLQTAPTRSQRGRNNRRNYPSTKSQHARQPSLIKRVSEQC